jgi:hypothetical protein
LFLGILLLIVPTVSLARVPQLSMAEALSSLEDEFPVPAAWSGIWTENIVEFDCDTEEQVDAYSFTDTLCTGDPAFVSDGSVPGLVCTGTVSDTQINMECSWSSEVFEGCTATFAVTMVGTRTGDSYQATSTLNISYVGGGPCEFLTGSCTREESTGTRIAPQPPTCITPVEDATWGGIKALYR